MSELKDIKSLSLNELNEEMSALGLPGYRSEQIFKWLHEKGVESFDEMLNIPKNIRKNLAELYYISVATIEKKQISCYDGTIKYLFKLHDGELIESVFMKYVETTADKNLDDIKRSCKFIHAVWFPSINQEDLARISFPADGDKEITLTSEALVEPKKYIDRIFNLEVQHGLETDLSGYQIKKLLKS